MQSVNNKRKASEVGIRGGEPAAKLANHPMAKPVALAGIQKVSRTPDVEQIAAFPAKLLHVSSTCTLALLDLMHLPFVLPDLGWRFSVGWCAGWLWRCKYGHSLGLHAHVCQRGHAHPCLRRQRRVQPRCQQQPPHRAGGLAGE